MFTIHVSLAAVYIQRRLIIRLSPYPRRPYMHGPYHLAYAVYALCVALCVLGHRGAVT